MRTLRARIDSPARSARNSALLFVNASLMVLIAGIVLLSLPMSTTAGAEDSFANIVLTAFGAFSGTFPGLDPGRDLTWFGQAVVLALIQIGGLGFMVGATLVLTIISRTAGSMSLRDSLMVRDGSPALSVRDARHISGKVLRFTLISEGIGAVALTAFFAGEKSIPEAIWHGCFYSISAFCNAGFDLTGSGASIVPYRDSFVFHATLFVLIQLGALSWLVLSDVWRARQWSRTQIQTRIVLIVHALLLVVGTTGMLLGEWNGLLADDGTAAKFGRAFFHSASARSAGYQSVDFAAGADSTLFLFILLMLIGGAPGSTAGGIRLTTVGVLIAAITSTVAGRSETEVMRRRLPPTLVPRALAIAVILFGVWFIVTLTVGLIERSTPSHLNFLQLAFESASATGSVGLTTGVARHLGVASTLLLSVAKLVGKVGPLTVAYSLQRRATTRPFRLPESTVSLG